MKYLSINLNIFGSIECRCLSVRVSVCPTKVCLVLAQMFKRLSQLFLFKQRQRDRAYEYFVLLGNILFCEIDWNQVLRCGREAGARRHREEGDKSFTGARTKTSASGTGPGLSLGSQAMNDNHSRKYSYIEERGKYFKFFLLCGYSNDACTYSSTVII